MSFYDGFKIDRFVSEKRVFLETNKGLIRDQLETSYELRVFDRFVN